MYIELEIINIGQNLIYKKVTANLFEFENQMFIYASVRDITKQKEYELAITSSRNELELIFNTALEGIALIDMEANYIKVNKKYCELFGYSEEEMLKLNFYDVADPTYIVKSKKIFQIVLRDGFYENFERFCITKSGEKRRFRNSVALMPDKQGFLITAIDNTELYNAFKRIEEQSYIDELTKLLNRKAYNEKISDMVEHYKRYSTIFSLALFDIDHFKLVNDTFGHDVGDKVLEKLSDVVKANIRKTDYLFRVGGEEFVVLLPNCHLEQAGRISEKIRRVVEDEIKAVTGTKITISIGLTEIAQEDSVDSIFKRADENLYESKARGRNRVTAV